MKSVIFCALVFVVINYVKCNMSAAQVKSAQKLMRSVCQPKVKATNAQIDGMHKGLFPKEPELMCYMECTLRTGQIMKDAKLNYESAHTQISNLPTDIVARTLESLEKCKDSAKSSDKCEAAFEFYKCYYDDNPSNFFLP